MHQLNFVRPNRVVRNSQRPQQQVVFDPQEWATFVGSVRAGQDF